MQPPSPAQVMPSSVCLCRCVCQCLFSGCCRVWLSCCWCSIVPKAVVSSAPAAPHSDGSATPVPSCSLWCFSKKSSFGTGAGWCFTGNCHLPKIIWHLQAPGADGPGCWVISGCQSCWAGDSPLGIQLWDAPGAAEPLCVGINHQTQHSHCQGSPGCKLFRENPKSVESSVMLLETNKQKKLNKSKFDCHIYSRKKS